ncbi:DedA family protein [Alkalihalophilus pseudofirmus]|uniref:DedA family protein n=1 Tax=Alkalihalophilus pseudofirmus TaxID=79885 RepID=UPI001EE422C8
MMVAFTEMISFIQSHGYMALFLIFSIGLFFFPVPNEILLMSGGLIATTAYVDPIPAMFVVYSSILVHGTSLYIVGHFLGTKSIPIKEERSIWYRRALKGKELLDRYGLKAASFSYFFPFIRHAVPFSVGLSAISYQRFAAIGFSSAFVWMNLYYWIGFHYGRSIKDWSSFVQQLIYTLIGIAILFGIYTFIKYRRERHRKQQPNDQ